MIISTSDRGDVTTLLLGDEVLVVLGALNEAGQYNSSC